MIRRYVSLALLSLACLLLQTNLALLFPSAYQPQLLLALAMVVAFSVPAPTALSIAFVFGVTVDLFSHQMPVGLHAGAYVAATAALCRMRPYLAATPAALILVVGASTLVVTVVSVGAARLVGAVDVNGVLLLQAAVFVTLYNVVAAPALDWMTKPLRVARALD